MVTEFSVNYGVILLCGNLSWALNVWFGREALSLRRRRPWRRQFWFSFLFAAKVDQVQLGHRPHPPPPHHHHHHHHHHHLLLLLLLLLLHLHLQLHQHHHQQEHKHHFFVNINVIRHIIIVVATIAIIITIEADGIVWYTSEWGKSRLVDQNSVDLEAPLSNAEVRQLTTRRNPKSSMRTCWLTFGHLVGENQKGGGFDSPANM